MKASISHALSLSRSDVQLIMAIIKAGAAVAALLVVWNGHTHTCVLHKLRGKCTGEYYTKF